MSVEAYRAQCALVAASAVIAGRACLTPLGAGYLGVAWYVMPPASGFGLTRHTRRRTDKPAAAPK